jgi:hypothetical protein
MMLGASLQWVGGVNRGPYTARSVLHGRVTRLLIYGVAGTLRTDAYSGHTAINSEPHRRSSLPHQCWRSASPLRQNRCLLGQLVCEPAARFGADTWKRGLATKKEKKIKSVLDTYEKKTPHEHILLRPGDVCVQAGFFVLTLLCGGMYIGQVEASKIDTWIYNDRSQLMEKKQLLYSPALIKVFSSSFVSMSL